MQSPFWNKTYIPDQEHEIAVATLAMLATHKKN